MYNKGYLYSFGIKSDFESNVIFQINIYVVMTIFSLLHNKITHVHM
jgi:hypothetical protein